MKDYKVLFHNGQYYICGSKYFTTLSDAKRGWDIEGGYIIANDYNDAQSLLVSTLEATGFYKSSK